MRWCRATASRRSVMNLTGRAGAVRSAGDSRGSIPGPVPPPRSSMTRRIPSSLCDDRVYSIHRDRSGTMWVGTREGLEEFEPRSGSFIHHKHREGDPNSLSDNWVWPILEDRAGDLWIGTFRGGLNKFDRKHADLHTFPSRRERSAESGGGSDLFSLSGPAGVIWVGMNDHGVDRFHPEFGAFQHLRP